MKPHQDLLDFIKNLYSPKTTIALHEPVFHGNEKKYIMDCIDSTFVSSIGSYVSRFELMVSQYTKIPYAIATTNGTAALHMALLLMGVQAGDEVITQALTFIATANAISYCNADPIFIDSEMDSLGMCPDSLETFIRENTETRDGALFNKKTGKRIKACLPMHVLGHALRIDRISDICKAHNLALIEDSAEAMGSFYKGQHLGSFGDIAVLSFNGNKTITTGGGGMILTKNPEIAKRAKHLTTTAKVPHPFEFYHDEVGYNYRLPNLNAALGCAQMEQLDDFVANKRATADKYQKFCAEHGYKFIHEPKDSISNYWLCSILLSDKQELKSFLEASNSQGILCRPLWNLIPDLPPYQRFQKGLIPNARFLQERVVNLPSGVCP